MNHRDGANLMGVGIDIRRGTMGGPAGMADTYRTAHRLFPKKCLKLRELSLTAPNLNHALTDHRYTGTVIAPVFQPFQPLHQQRYTVILTNVSDDTAHFQPLILVLGIMHFLWEWLSSHDYC